LDGYFWSDIDAVSKAEEEGVARKALEVTFRETPKWQ
jgi:hypothetical protein